MRSQTAVNVGRLDIHFAPCNTPPISLQGRAVDIFNFAKAVEQGIFDIMMWVFFYPWTLLRMVLRPHRMLIYVREQSQLAPDNAFSSAMRPALFLFISITLGTLIAPLGPAEIETMQQSQVGRLIANSWFLLIFYRMVTFAAFPLVGAVILDALTPGRITRDTLRTPFYLQCYICAPYALVESPALVAFGRGDASDWLVALFGAAIVWFLACQYIFFRQNAEVGRVAAALIAPVVLIGGLLMVVSFAVLTF